MRIKATIELTRAEVEALVASHVNERFPLFSGGVMTIGGDYSFQKVPEFLTVTYLDKDSDQEPPAIEDVAIPETLPNLGSVSESVGSVSESVKDQPF